MVGALVDSDKRLKQIAADIVIPSSSVNHARHHVAKPLVEDEAVKALKVSGKGPAEIAKMLGIGRASVYRALEKE